MAESDKVRNHFLMNVIFTAADRILLEQRVLRTNLRSIYLGYFADKLWASHIVCHVFDELPVVLDEYQINTFNNYFKKTLEEESNERGLSETDVHIFSALLNRL